MRVVRRSVSLIVCHGFSCNEFIAFGYPTASSGPESHVKGSRRFHLWSCKRIIPPSNCGWSTVSAPADPHLSSVKRQICDANAYPGEGGHVGGNGGIYTP